MAVRLCLYGLRFDAAVRVISSTAATPVPYGTGIPVGVENDLQFGDERRQQIRKIEIAQVIDAEIWPFMVPWPLAMMAPNGCGNSLTMTPDPCRRRFTAVTEKPGEPVRTVPDPALHGGAGCRASNWAFTMRCGMPIVDVAQRLGHCQNQGSGRIQLDSPASPLFFSFLRLK